MPVRPLRARLRARRWPRRGLVFSVVASERSYAATRYEDLSLFSSVLRIVRDNYVERGGRVAT